TSQAVAARRNGQILIFVAPQIRTHRLGTFCLVAEDLAVSPGRHGLTGWPTDDLVNRRSGVQKRRVPVLRPVLGIAYIACDLELHMPHNRAEVALLKCRWCSRSCNVLSRTDLNEVDPFDLDRAAVLG